MRTAPSVVRARRSGRAAGDEDFILVDRRSLEWVTRCTEKIVRATGGVGLIVADGWDFEGFVMFAVELATRAGDAGPVDADVIGLVFREEAGFAGDVEGGEAGLLLGEAESIEDGVGDVAEDGGASWADAILGEQDEDAGLEAGDVGDGGEVGQFGREVGERIGGSVGFAFGLGVNTGVGAAERRIGMMDAEAAAASSGGDIGTERGRCKGAGVVAFHE